LPETYFLVVIMAADAPAQPFHSFKQHASVKPCNKKKVDFPGSFFDF
jgi:hypothetical protein